MAKLLSVIIPIYNEEATLRSILQKVVKSAENLKRYNIRTEIITVNDGSTDKTREIAESLNVKVIQGKHRGKVDALNLGVKEAKNDDTLMHGRILIAPGDLHMEVKKDGFMYKIALKNYPKVNSHKPSVNVLFMSMAKEVGIVGVGIIMTGMGDDGASGLLAMKQSGAKTYAQDEKSSIVYGMPKKAVELGGAIDVLNIQQIAQLINRI